MSATQIVPSALCDRVPLRRASTTVPSTSALTAAARCRTMLGGIGGSNVDMRHIIADAMCTLSTYHHGSLRPALLAAARSEEHTSELQSQFHLVCRLLLEKKNN